MKARAAAEVIALSAAAVTSIWVSRVVGVQYFGLFAVVATALAFLQAVTDGGLPSLGAQLIANDVASARAVWRGVARARAIGAALGVLCGAVMLSAIPLDAAPRALLIGALASLVLTPLNASFALVAVGAIRWVALVRALGALASMMIALLLIRSQADAPALSVLLVAPSAVMGICSLVLVSRLMPPEAPHRSEGMMPESVRLWYARGFDYAKADLSLLVYMSADRFILFATGGAAVVGIYEAAYRIIQPFYAISTVIRESMFLDLARDLGTPRLQGTLKRWISLMFTATIPVGPFLMLHSGWVIQLVYGPDYRDAALPLSILGWVITSGFISGAIVLPFLSWNRGREYGNAILAGNVTNLAGNLLLTPAFGPAGAALATVAAKLAVALAGLRTFSRTSSVAILGESVRFISASAAAALASLGIEAVSGDERAAIIAFGGTYWLALIWAEFASAGKVVTVRDEL
jgi:O-antigen/teichoic acid export membrane protein